MIQQTVQSDIETMLPHETCIASPGTTILPKLFSSSRVMPTRNLDRQRILSAAVILISGVTWATLVEMLKSASCRKRRRRI
jgi:hypothetical protein